MTKRMRKASAGVLMAVAAAITCMAPAAETIAPLQSVSISASAAATWSNDTATFTYTVKDGYAVISKVAPKGKKNYAGVTYVFIPSDINGYKIALGSYAFNQISTPIDINASNVKKVEKYAFYRCTAIDEISLAGCEDLATYGIYRCSNLKSVCFPGVQSATTDGSTLNINTDGIYYCPDLENVSFGCKDDIIIHTRAFSGCTKLKGFNKWSISSDHASFYPHTNAFSSSGINGSGTIKTASFMSKYNGRYNVGDGKKMTGKTVAVTLFVNTTDTPSWTYGSRYGYNSNVGRNVYELEQEAVKYNQTLDIEHLNVNVSSKMKKSAVESNGNFSRSSVVLNACKNTFSYLSECTNMDQVTDKIKSQLNADNVVYMVAINSGGRAKAYSFKTANEYAVVYKDGQSAPYLDEYTWMHEFCHLFGAMDVYEGSGVANSGYTNQFLSMDIMNQNKPNVGWFTACNIGWTNTVLLDDFNNIVVMDAAPTSFDY